jgi:hypothetical protein
VESLTIGSFIPIATIFGPGALNIVTTMEDSTQQMHVPKLSIAQAGGYERFAYAVNTTAPGSQKYLGPRTVIHRLALAAAATGEILSFAMPVTNLTYEQTFYAPYVTCSESSTEVRQQTDNMISRFKDDLDPSIELVTLSYFAEVPALTNLANTSAVDIEAANLTDGADALYASNQLWLYTSNIEASDDFSKPEQHKYLMCELYNSTYTATFTWVNGRKHIDVVNRDLLHPVAYPANPSSTSEVSEENMAYSSIMWAITNRLVGTIAFYRDVDGGNEDETQSFASRNYSRIDTDLSHTVLLGTSDLNAHFRQNHRLGGDKDTEPYSDQRLQDMAYAGNRPLQVLISELSSNITFSLMNDPLLAPRLPQTVTISSPVNKYVYHSKNVLIAYITVCVAAAMANGAGMHAIRKSGVSHNTSFSSIAFATHSIHVSGLDPYERRGALPLDPEVAKIPLKFYNGYKPPGAQHRLFGWSRAVLEQEPDVEAGYPAHLLTEEKDIPVKEADVLVPTVDSRPTKSLNSDQKDSPLDLESASDAACASAATETPNLQTNSAGRLDPT